jgi:hypothetical protein
VMGTELLILIGFILSFRALWPARDQDPDWRRSFNHENMNKPSGPPPLLFRRSGYRSINYPDPSPDRRPTNPYTGEPVDFTEGPTQRGNGSGEP